jgi:hypothetical protein
VHLFLIYNSIKCVLASTLQTHGSHWRVNNPSAACLPVLRPLLTIVQEEFRSAKSRLNAGRRRAIAHALLDYRIGNSASARRGGFRWLDIGVSLDPLK